MIITQLLIIARLETLLFDPADVYTTSVLDIGISLSYPSPTFTFTLTLAFPLPWPFCLPSLLPSLPLHLPSTWPLPSTSCLPLLPLPLPLSWDLPSPWPYLNLVLPYLTFTFDLTFTLSYSFHMHLYCFGVRSQCGHGVLALASCRVTSGHIGDAGPAIEGPRCTPKCWSKPMETVIVMCGFLLSFQQPTFEKVARHQRASHDPPRLGSSAAQRRTGAPRDPSGRRTQAAPEGERGSR